MALNDNSLAPALGIGGINVAQAVTAEVLKRKILLIGTFDPALTAVIPEVPKRVFSPEDVGAQTGFGFMLHRMAIQAFKFATTPEIFIQPQDEAGGGAQALGSILVTAAAGLAGTFFFYIAGLVVSVNLAAADDEAATAVKIIDAINADNDLPVTALVDGGTPELVNITSRSEGLHWGNEITLRANIKGESSPGSLAFTIVPMAGGVGTPDITPALDALGVGSGQNSDFFTDVLHGYGPITSVLDKLQTYNGIANDEVGNFDDLVHKPFRSLNGDNVAGIPGLSALIAFGNGRKETDRTSGILPVPGSASHPVEIACQGIGRMAQRNSSKAELSYKGFILDGIDPGPVADRWTDQYSTGRDAAAQAGISSTLVVSGVVKMQNALSFYHPVSISQKSNAYRNMRNISLLQNIFNTIQIEFSKEEWQQFSVVEDLAFVSDSSNRETAKSTSSVKNTWLALYTAFAGKAWIASLRFSLDKLKEDGSVVIRGAGNGFNTKTAFIFSGDGDIIDNNVEFDTSFAILNT